MAVALRVRHEDLGIMNPQIEDPVVADEIIALCPARTYTAITVQTIPHHFRGTPNEERHPSRMIEFQTTNLQSLWHDLSIIFLITNTPISINTTRATLGLLGSQNPIDLAEAREAYMNNYIITIYGAMDGSELIEYCGNVSPTTLRISTSCILI